jgi:hypothetical protein
LSDKIETVMVTIAHFRQLALSYPDAVEMPHFDLTSFRWKKKIFATYHAKDNRAMLKLSAVDQSVFCSWDPGVIFPVPGGWGRSGATFVELSRVPKPMFRDALGRAYDRLAGPKGGTSKAPKPLLGKRR